MTHQLFGYFISALRFAIVLGILVLVHEFGHFLVAKLCKVRVEIFSLGFGRRLFGFQHGDTDYRLSLLPLGGYVKMAGENPGEASSGDPGEFSQHPRWQRMLIAMAGPASNIILAFLIMTFVYMHHHEVDSYLTGAAVNDYTVAGSVAARSGIQPGDTIVHFDDKEGPDWESIVLSSLLNQNRVVKFSYLHNGQRHDGTLLVDLHGNSPNAVQDDPRLLFTSIGFVPRAQNMPIKIENLENDMPAERAGLQLNDEIISINTLAVHSVPALHAYMQDEAGKPATLTVLRQGHLLYVPVVPERTTDPDGTPAYRLGFKQVDSPTVVDKLPFGQAAIESYKFNEKNCTLIRKVLTGMFQRHVSVRQLSGPVGIFQQVNIAAQDGIWILAAFTAMLSINLAIFNLLPIPILDGGMLLFLIIEAVFRRDMNQAVKERIYQVAFVCLLLLFVMVIVNDISKMKI